jgi:hypothetical protein
MEACKSENGSLCRAIGSQWSDHQLISLIDELLIEIVDFLCVCMIRLVDLPHYQIEMSCGGIELIFGDKPSILISRLLCDGLAVGLPPLYWS